MSSDEASKFADEVREYMKAIEARGGGFVALSRFDRGSEAAGVVGGYDRVFLAEAQRAAVRSEEASRGGNSPVEAGATAAAILCAAAACEARLSEYLALSEFVDGTLTTELEQLRTIWDAREQWNRLLAFKAPMFDLGNSGEYRALACLFRLRDHIAHRHARISTLGTFPVKLDDCIRQGTIPVRRAERADWTSVLLLHEIARWAATTASDWLRVVNDVLPSPRLCR